MKTKKPKKLPDPVYPPDHPEALARMAETMEWKTTARNFAVQDYIEAIRTLRARGYSYADTANWLTEKLKGKLEHRRITRGQVYRVYQEWLEREDPFHVGKRVKPLDDEAAEAEAEFSDQKPPENTKENKP